METPENTERYQVLSPVEKNYELFRMFKSIPQIAYFGTEVVDPAATLKNRQNSEFKIRTADNMKVLVAFSQLTPSGQAHLIDEYVHRYETGLSIREEDIPLLIQQLSERWGFDDPDGGIFGENSSREIERRIYREEALINRSKFRMIEKLKNDESFQNLIEKAKTNAFMYEASKPLMSEEEREAAEKTDEEGKELFRKTEEQEGRFKRWRLEYIEKYGDEP